MSEHDRPEPSSPGEIAALDRLDRLARRAAGALVSAIPPELGDRLPGTPASAGDAGADPNGTTVASPASAAGPAAARRRVAWAALAAAAIVAVVAAVAVVAGNDDGADVATGKPSYLLPRWLPDGWTALTATSGATAPPQVSSATGGVAVYGDASAADPWAGPVLAVMVADGVPGAGLDDTDGEPVDVGGRAGRLSRADGGDGWTVTLTTDGGRLVVQGRRGVTRDQVVTAAANASERPAIAPDGLPDGFAELARGGLDALGPATMTYAGRDWLAVSYADPRAGADGPDVGLGLLQRPGTTAAVDLLRFLSADAEPTTVRGHHAVMLPFERDGGFVLQWLEPGGVLVTVAGYGMPEDRVRRFAEGLAPAGDDEVASLLDEEGTGTHGGSMPLADDEILAASGQDGEVSWQLVVVDGGRGISFRTSDGSDAGAGGTSVPGSAGARPGQLFADSTHYAVPGDGVQTVVYGLAEPRSVQVVLERPGAPPLTLDSYEVSLGDGTTVVAFVGFVPLHRPTDAQVVARATGGTELARQPVHLNGGDATSPGDGSDGVVSEECHPAGDGSYECSGSSAGAVEAGSGRTG